MADVPAGFEVVKTASGAPPGFEVVKPGAGASAPAASPPPSDGRIHLGEAQDAEHMSTAEYAVDQFDRAPFKMLDFLHSMSPVGVTDKLRSYLPEKFGGKPAEKGYGEQIAEKLLGKESESTGLTQSLTGAAAGAAATGGTG